MSESFWDGMKKTHRGLLQGKYKDNEKENLKIEEEIEKIEEEI